MIEYIMAGEVTIFTDKIAEHSMVKVKVTLL